MALLVDEVLEAHGGLDRWRRFSKVEADAGVALSAADAELSWPELPVPPPPRRFDGDEVPAYRPSAATRRLRTSACGAWKSTKPLPPAIR